MNERLYWLGFDLAKGIGPARVRRLLEHFGSLEEAWHATASNLEAAGLDRRTIRQLVELRRKVDPAAELARLDKLGIAMLTWDDGDYPALLAQLREIDQAPPVIYLRGSLVEADEWAIAVVGTRSVSAYGRQVTYQFAQELASHGLTVVSGLARGADAEAHRAALETGGRTIAVLPCGLDMIYPPENRQLASKIVQNGAVMSIFAPGTKPLRTNFPARNRAISGLARGVLVTEAGDRSGALLTAAAALEQGRDVFAIPGNITARGSAGVNRLIQDGAHPVMSASDILTAMKLERVVEHASARAQLPPASSDEKIVLDNLSAEPVHADELAHRCGLPIAAVSSTLVTLELKGMVRQVGPMTYVRS
jgi:DNA processing protein